DYYKLIWDFSIYDDDFIDNDSQSDLGLNDIKIKFLSTSKKELSLYTNHDTGTVIIIENLTDKWTLNKIKDFAVDITTFSPIKLYAESQIDENAFSIKIYRDSQLLSFLDDKGKPTDINTFEIEYLKSLIENEAIYRIDDGLFNEMTGDISFNLTSGPNGNTSQILTNIKEFRNWETFKQGKKQNLFDTSTKCGDFRFNTYIFNFDKKSFKDFNVLNREQRNFLKKYNIYLYRDGARVLPYGNAGIDWLEIEKLRAETRAGDYFSQGQLVGQIFTSREKNPAFQDKTSREGLIISGLEFDKLKAIYRLILEYVKMKYFDMQKKRELNRVKADEAKEDTVTNQIEQVMSKNKENPEFLKDIHSIQAKYNKTMVVYKQKLDIVEQLAGAGMSIEISSHELYSSMIKLGSKILREEEIINNLSNQIDIEILKNVNSDTKLLHKIALHQLDNIQKLLVSSKQRIKKIKVNDEIIEITNLYKEKLIKKSINLELINATKTIIAETIDAVIYQTICNLIDNSIYWLDNEEIFNREILINFDQHNNRIIFADNGPGIEPEDAPYVFDAFFSGKGVKGRGLGLYISKRLLNKYDFDIRIAKKPERILNGANFIIDFSGKE
ncbi:MAG: sensor histidine kinase, partial [Vulcanibacillus sp.]